MIRLGVFEVTLCALLYASFYPFREVTYAV